MEKKITKIPIFCRFYLQASGFQVMNYFFVIIFYFLYKDTIGKDMLFELQLQSHCKIRNNEVLI